MITILKKELKSYFLSPIGYVVMGIFLLCFSVFFYLTVFSQGIIDLGALYYYTALYGLIVIVPILTMRMFSGEKTGTEQLLLTSPVSITKIVMGKFLAALLVVILTLVISLMFFAILSFFGNPNIISTLVAILGFILISMAALSIGMLASSLTENQIIAGIITIAFLIISLFAGSINPVFSNFTLIDYYMSFARGILSLENAISLVLFAFVFISLTIIVLQRRKLVK